MSRSTLLWGASLVAVALLQFVLPDWLVFILTLGFAKSLVAVGVVLLMRAGLVSFGQGLFLAAGAYVAAFATQFWHVNEVLILLAIGAATGFILSYLIGLLIARYREIFFGMLSLAFSMAVYGALVKTYALGGSDGFNIPPPTILGYQLEARSLQLVAYFLALGSVVVTAYLTHLYSEAPIGYVMKAIRDNEIRVEYLGGSVGGAVARTFALAGALAGLSGALLGVAVGHVDPGLAYWTTSGEFVFVGLLSGTGSVLAPVGGSILIEFLKTYAYKYAPYTWQMVLGSIMLVIILFLPGGLWSLYERVRMREVKT